MPVEIRKVNYAYLTVTSKAGEASRILGAVRDANINLLAFTGFPQGRTKAQVDLFATDLTPLKALAKKHKWTLSRPKRAFLAQGMDEVGAAMGPLATLGDAKINIIAADAVAAGEGRFGMIFWVASPDYNRAATLLGAT
jgi:hypothetical protein